MANRYRVVQPSAGDHFWHVVDADSNQFSIADVYKQVPHAKELVESIARHMNRLEAAKC